MNTIINSKGEHTPFPRSQAMEAAASGNTLGRNRLQGAGDTTSKPQDNADRLHEALDRMEIILRAQHEFINKLTGEDGLNEPCEDEQRRQPPSMQVILQGAPTAIDGVIDRALKNMDVIREIIYGG